MPIIALGLSAIEKRWFPKVIRAIDKEIERDLAELVRGRVVRYFAYLHEAEPQIGLAPDMDGGSVFNITFDGRGWDTIEQALPGARAQYISGLIALAGPLELPKGDLERYRVTLGLPSVSIRVLPRAEPRPRAPDHSRARELLPDEVCWDPCDEYGIGGDTGADVVGMYSEWRAHHSAASRDGFFEGLLKSWGCGEEDEDDAAIAFAIAQLRFDGNLSATARSKALAAVERQRSDAVISDRRWDSPGRRRKALEIMRSAIERGSVA